MFYLWSLEILMTVIKSKYANKCRDCGIKYAVGDEIDTNGKQSKNNNGEMKDHWCKMGQSCQGASIAGENKYRVYYEGYPPTLDVKSKPLLAPTVEQLRANLVKIDKDTPIDNSEYYKMILEYLRCREHCESIGIYTPAVIGMIFNNVIRDRQ